MFKLDSKANGNGTSLQLFPEGINTVQLINLLGPPNRDWEDEENGYDGTEWRFSSEVGVVTIYTRWGRLRIGAHSRGTAELFLVWLKGQLG